MNTQERSMLLNFMIKHLRINKHWTQEQLGLKIGCSQREIWRYEKPGYKVSPQVLIKLSDTFNVSLDVLFGNTTNTSVFKAKQELMQYLEIQKLE